ncbi:SMI1/KNR4 family protein, partial [Salmonella enterica subsp. enterica]|nr:SMI1/KNR4 family protein [Salmonella enterica subsp. enterica serovar Paratyphi A]
MAATLPSNRRLSAGLHPAPLCFNLPGMQNPKLIDELVAASGNVGAAPDAIAACERRLGVTFPADYRAFLLRSDGFSDDVGKGYLVLWSVAEVGGADAYEFHPVAPGRFLIGSNGGPTAYAVHDGRYVSIPFDGGEADMR